MYEAKQIILYSHIEFLYSLQHYVTYTILII